MKFEILGYKYDVGKYELKGYINYVEDVLNHLDKPFVIDVNRMGNLIDNLMSTYHEDTLYVLQKVLNELTDKENYWEVIEDLADEDKQWTAERNKDYQYVAYRKFTFKPEVIAKLQKEYTDILNFLKLELNELEEMKNREKQEKENRKSLYNFGNVYKKQYPRGGEEGKDGYFDVEIINNTTEESIRFVTRDVFDFGCYNYPKRLEGSQEIFEKASWTDEEQKISQWLNEFSPFTKYVRM